MSRVLISMPEKFLEEIDTVAGNENRSRREHTSIAIKSEKTHLQLKMQLFSRHYWTNVKI